MPLTPGFLVYELMRCQQARSGRRQRRKTMHKYERSRRIAGVATVFAMGLIAASIPVQSASAEHHAQSSLYYYSNSAYYYTPAAPTYYYTPAPTYYYTPAPTYYYTPAPTYYYTPTPTYYSAPPTYYPVPQPYYDDSWSGPWV